MPQLSPMTRASTPDARARIPDPDLSDVALAVAGDRDAYERVYHRHSPGIYRLAQRFVGRELAEDATQDVFVHAWTRLAQFRGEALFATWLHRLAANLLMRQAESARRIASRYAAADVDALHISGESPAASIDVDTALMRLNEEVRAVVALHDMEGYAHTEIAEALGISVSASKMRLHRGRMQLREWLLR